MTVAMTQLIPIKEMLPVTVGAIRNQVIEALVAQASHELNLPATDLVVRDVRPFNDLQMYSGGTTASTVDTWAFDTTTTAAAAFVTVTGAKQMGDQRYVAIWGVRDLKNAQGLHSTSMGTNPSVLLLPITGTVHAASFADMWPQVVNQVKINVGGSDKVLWDLTGMYAYKDDCCGISPGAVIIPQNASYNIYYQLRGHIVNTTAAPGQSARIQLIGVVVEPRGKVISP